MSLFGGLPPSASERRPPPYAPHLAEARRRQRVRRRRRRAHHLERLRVRSPRIAVFVITAALVRMIAQILADVSAGRSPFYGPDTDAATIAFGVGLMLAGTVLPLGLVRPWGRTWPRWLPGIAGRVVPRWLVLAPAGLLAVGMTVIFGMSMVQFLLAPVTSTASSDYPLVFWWFVLPAYLAWGVGLLLLVIAYWHGTHPAPYDPPERPEGGSAMVGVLLGRPDPTAARMTTNPNSKENAFPWRYVAEPGGEAAGAPSDDSRSRPRAATYEARRHRSR